METTKNMIATWTDTQNKIVENWVETTKKLQTTGSSDNVMQKGVEFYKEWFENQKNIIADAIKKSTENPSATTPESLKNWLNVQREFTSKWMEAMNSAIQGQDINTNPQEILNKGKEMYDKWSIHFKETFEKMTNMKFDNSAYSANMSSYKEMMEKFMSGNFMSEMAQNMQNAMPSYMKEANQKMQEMMPSYMKEASQKMMDASKAYGNMFEFWQPYYKMMSNNNFDPKDFMKNMNMESYQQAMSEMFGLFTPNKMQDMSAQMTKFMENYRDMMSKFMGTNNNPMTDMMNQMANMMPAGMKADMTAFTNLQKSFMAKMQEVYAPFSKLVPPSREKDMSEMVMTMQSNLNNYQMKVSEMNFMVMTAAQKAMENVSNELFENMKKGESVKTYNEFFSHWVNVLENQLVELFSSNAFSSVQGEVLSLQFDIRHAMKRGMEFVLEPYPVALNSDVAEMSKTVHELKARIRTLEKQLNIADAEVAEVVEEVAEAKPAAKRKAAK